MRHYALAFLRYTAARDHNLEPYILPWIVSDMPAELTQIEIGLLTIIEEAAISGLQEAELLVAYWRDLKETGEVRQRHSRCGIVLPAPPQPAGFFSH